VRITICPPQHIQNPKVGTSDHRISQEQYIKAVLTAQATGFLCSICVQSDTTNQQVRLSRIPAMLRTTSTPAACQSSSHHE